MSELRQAEEHDTPPTWQEALNGMQERDPMGSFFDPIPHSDAVEALIRPHSKQQRGILESESGGSAILHALDQLGTFTSQSPTLQKRLTRNQGAMRGLIYTAEEYYKKDFWTDFRHRSGQDLDKLTELHDKTDPYAASSDLHSIFEIIHAQNPANHHVTDALRIIKLILLNEREDEETTLP